MLYGISEEYVDGIVTYGLLYTPWLDLWLMLSSACKNHKFLFYICSDYC